MPSCCQKNACLENSTNFLTVNACVLHSEWVLCPFVIKKRNLLFCEYTRTDCRRKDTRTEFRMVLSHFLPGSVTKYFRFVTILPYMNESYSLHSVFYFSQLFTRLLGRNWDMGKLTRNLRRSSFYFCNMLKIH